MLYVLLVKSPCVPVTQNKLQLKKKSWTYTGIDRSWLLMNKTFVFSMLCVAFCFRPKSLCPQIKKRSMFNLKFFWYKTFHTIDGNTKALLNENLKRCSNVSCKLQFDQLKKKPYNIAITFLWTLYNDVSSFLVFI